MGVFKDSHEKDHTDWYKMLKCAERAEFLFLPMIADVLKDRRQSKMYSRVKKGTSSDSEKRFPARG